MKDSRRYFADHVWQPQGWLDNAVLEVDDGRYLKGALLDVSTRES